MQEIGYPGVGTIAWQGLFAPAVRRKRCWKPCSRPPSRRCRRPRWSEAFKKQYFNIVPNKSLDDAKAWLEDEIKHLEGHHRQVKIEAAE